MTIVFDTNENSTKEMLKYLNVKGVKKGNISPHNLIRQCLGKIIDECLGMIYDTTDTEKLYS